MKMMFQSLIGTVQHSLNVKNALEKLTIPFQSLIGTVQRYIMIINYEFYAKGFNLS